MGKYKLKCFICGNKFNSKEEVYKNKNNYPVHKDCLYEELYDTEWEDGETIEQIIKEVKNKFNRNYKRWKKWFLENHVICNGEHDDYRIFYVHKDEAVIVNGKLYCELCAILIKENKIKK